MQYEHTTVRNLQAMLLIGLMIAALGLGACNTIGGAGEDLEAAGDTISDTADDAAN